MPDLQLSWTGAEVVAWAWDGRATGRVATSSPLYGLMIREWGWLPPGSWGTRIIVDSPLRKMDVPAVVVPAMAVIEAAATPRRRTEVSASSAWVRNLVALARHTASQGHMRPELLVGSPQHRVRWIPIETAALTEALIARAGRCPPVVYSTHRTERLTKEPDLPADPVAFTTAFHAWLVDLAARQSLRMHHWAPDLLGRRSSEASAMRAVGRALSQSTDVVGPIKSELVTAAITPLARGFERLRSSATGEPLVVAHLRLGLPSDTSDPEAPWPLSIEIADRDDPSRWCSAADVWAQSPLAAELAGKPEHFAVLAAAARNARDRLMAIESLTDVLAGFDVFEPSAIDLDVEGAASMLDAIDDLEAAGIPLLAPGQLAPRTASVRGAATPATESDGRLGRQALVSWSVDVAGEAVDEAVLERAAATGASLIHAGGRWIRVDRAAARRALTNLRDHRAKHAKVDAATLLRLAAELADAELDALDRLDADDGSVARRPGLHAVDDVDDDAGSSSGGWLADLLAGLPDDRLAEGEVPAGFAGTLRPYQLRGLGWLQFLARLGFGGCLADDMGLGKTPTTLAHLAGRPGPHLVLCPLSVVRNWQAEAARFAPLARVIVHHGTVRDRGDALAHRIASADIVITTYGLAVRDLADLGPTRWTTVVLDEAQAVKNAHTHAARMVRKLHAEQKVALTGTPVENRLGELWAILDVVNPGLLGTERVFHGRWTVPIERHADEKAAAHLRRLTGPFVLRRTKADRSLVPDLPDKVEQIAWASLTREQAAMYQAVVDHLLQEAEAAEGMKRRGLVLAALTRLKQICNHPAQAAGDGSKLAGRSGKLARFDELVADLVDAEERALVFTQYREMGLLLQRHISDHFGLAVPFLHGGVPKSRRDRMVDDFQAGVGAPVLLVSLKAGGTGLNLTSASRVIHYDRWWNPAVEDQATDRAWRIGQHRAVFVHKLVCQGTVEERISELIDDKRRLAGMVIGAGAGEGWVSELSTSELRDLVTLGREAVE